MKVIRFLPWWLVIVALCAISAWHFRLNLISGGINLLFVDGEIKQLKYELKSIDFSNASLPRLEFELSVNDRTVSFHAEKVTLQYHIENVYARIIDSIHIERLAIRSRDTDKASEKSIGKSVDIDTVLRSLVAIITQAIPVKHIAVEALAISENGFDLTQKQAPKFILDADQKSTKIQLLQNKFELNFDVVDNTISVILTDNNNLSTFAGNLVLINNGGNTTQAVSGEFFIELERLRRWLQDLLQIELPDLGGSLNIALAGTSTASPGQNKWNIEISGNASELSSGSMEISNTVFEYYLSAPRVVTPETYSISVSSESRMKIGQFVMDKFQVDNLDLTPSGVVGAEAGSYFVSFDENATLSFDALIQGDLSLTNAKLVPMMHLSLLPNQSVLDLHTGASLSAGQLTFNGFRLNKPKAVIRSQSGFAISTNVEEPVWQLSGGKWLVSNLDLAMDDKFMRSNALIIDLGQISESSLSLRFTTNRTDVHFDLAEAVFSSINGNIDLEDHAVMIEGEFGLIGLPPVFHFTTQSNLDNQNGGFTLAQVKTLDITSHSSQFNEFIANWVPDLALDQGLLTVNANGHWKDTSNLQNNIQFELTNVSGHYAEVAFSGLDVVGPIFFPPIHQSDSASVNIQSLEYGVKIENIKSEFRLSMPDSRIPNRNELPGVIVGSLKGEILGSNFESNEFEFDPNAEENHIDISVFGLDINEIVSMQQIEGLSATGKLDGKLPIDFNSDGVNIELGQFWSRQDGGTIKYLLDDTQAELLSNPLTDTVTKALEEFHYDLLTASTNFRPDGELSIKFHIEGKSPLLDSNRPVHLNINSEQNVLSLLKSLKYTEDLNGQLDDNIRKKILTSEKTD